MNDVLGTSAQNLDRSRSQYLASLNSSRDIESALRDTIKEVLSPDVMKLAEERGNAAKAYSTAPTQADTMFSDIENPTDRRTLSANYIGDKLKDFVTASTLSDTLGGTMGGLLDSILRIEGQKQNAYKDQYGIAQDSYNSALDQFFKQQSLGLEAARLNQSQIAEQQGAVADLLKPYKAEKQNVLDAMNAINYIDQAISLLKQGVKTGPVSGRALKFSTQTLGNAGENEIKLYNLLSDVGINKLVDLGGKVLPAKELELFTQAIPRYTKPTETNIADLIQMRNQIENGINNKLYGIDRILGPGVDPLEYL